MEKYAISLDIGYFDSTVAILAKIQDNDIYVIEEKNTEFVGENKINENQMEEIRKFWFHYCMERKKGYSAISESNKIFIPKILGWEKYNVKIENIFVDGPRF